MSISELDGRVMPFKQQLKRETKNRYVSLLDMGALVNAQGGEYGNALQAASWQGNEALVRLLLEKGVDVHAVGGHYGNALEAATSEAKKVVVRLLLGKRARRFL